MTPYTIIPLPDFPNYEERAGHLAQQWADFIYHEVDAIDYYPTMVQACQHLHFFICEGDDVVAHGQSMALQWDGTTENLPLGWSDAIMRCAKNHLEKTAVNTLCGVSATVAPNHTGKGLGRKVIETMKQLAYDNGFEHMIAPVRPSQKSQYPLIQMEDYITWQRDDGLFFDKWLRIHQRLGASILKVAPHSMRVIGSVADWKKWTEQRFPDSGMYIIDGALSPVFIDYDNDEGIYVEPNVWMEHPL